MADWLGLGELSAAAGAMPFAIAVAGIRKAAITMPNRMGVARVQSGNRFTARDPLTF